MFYYNRIGISERIDPNKIIKLKNAWFATIGFITLWLLMGDPVNPSLYVFVVFSYLLNFCWQWHLCKFLILGDLSTHLFGLVLPRPTSEKMKVRVQRTHSLPLLLKLCFLKNSLKMLPRHFLYMFVFTHPCTL